MQNPTLTNISPTSERLLALIAEGMGQFEQKESISNCQKCILSSTRKRVAVASKFTPKQFFILAEFPETEDEISSTVFSRNGSSGIILNLIDKLGIQDSCHYAFALKCVSSKQNPSDNMAVCVMENLKKELALIQPQTIFCFGMRAFLALWRLGVDITIPPSENTRQCLRLSHATVDLYILPTPQELKLFPHWRLSVWSKLEHFKQKKNIDC